MTRKPHSVLALAVLLIVSMTIGPGPAGQANVPLARADTTASSNLSAVSQVTASPASRASATARPTIAASPSPSRTAVPSATSTPLSPAAAADLLASGRWHQLIGDCEWARREFAELIAAQPAPALAAEAHYRMAQCYLRDAAPIEAADTLAALLDTAPRNDPHRGPATFLLGEALSALGRWKEAEASYNVHLPLAPELQYLTWQRIGAARQAQANPVAAIEAYRSALAKSPDWNNTVAIRRTLADLALAQDQIQEAVAQYDALRGDNTTGALAAEMQYLAGNALALTPVAAAATVTPTGTVTVTPPIVSEKALERWRAAVDADVTTRWAHASIVALLDAGQPVDEFKRGLANYHTGVYDLAIAAFDRLRAAEPDGRDGLAGYYAGLSYIALGDAASGIAELDAFIAKYPDSPQWPDAWLAKARVQARSGQVDAALATYRKLAETRPKAPQAAKALWQVAIMSDPEPPVRSAAEAYLDMARRFPKGEDTWRAYHNAGVILLRLGEWAEAAKVWQEMAQQPDLAAFTRPVAYYWLGRARLEQGDRAGAEQAWKSAQESGPGSYYALRAQAWAEGREDEAMNGRAGQTGGTAAAQSYTAAQEKAEITAWLKTWAATGTLALPQAVLTDGDWLRGESLLELGLRPAALAQWERMRTRYAKEPWTMAALAIAFRDAGANRLSLLAAEQVVALSGKQMADTPVPLQRLAYPMPYSDLIRAEAAKHKLDPRLLAAIIRQESRFEAGVASVAGAQGLMQVMPGTATGIASQLAWPDFEPSHAYWPYVNVAFGAYYINQWTSHFSDSLFAGLAAYNGGPGNATTWRGWVPEDDDLFAAAININETRVYVQAVWSHYDAYRRLYSE